MQPPHIGNITYTLSPNLKRRGEEEAVIHRHPEIQTVKGRRTPAFSVRLHPRGCSFLTPCKGGLLGADARKMRTDACAPLRTSVHRQPRRTYTRTWSAREPHIARAAYVHTCVVPHRSHRHPEHNANNNLSPSWHPSLRRFQQMLPDPRDPSVHGGLLVLSRRGRARVFGAHNEPQRQVWTPLHGFVTSACPTRAGAEYSPLPVKRTSSLAPFLSLAPFIFSLASVLRQGCRLCLGATSSPATTGKAGHVRLSRYQRGRHMASLGVDPRNVLRLLFGNVG